jgi:hypothetical protein
LTIGIQTILAPRQRADSAAVGRHCRHAVLGTAFDRIGSPRASPLAWRQAGEGEEPIAGFLEAIGDGTVFEPPLAGESLAARCLRRNL